jgi:hypothetical protein
MAPWNPSETHQGFSTRPAGNQRLREPIVLELIAPMGHTYASANFSFKEQCSFKSPAA